MQSLATNLIALFSGVSVLVAIILFYMEYRKSRRDRGYETYIQTLLSQVEIEKMFIQYPELQKLILLRKR